MEKAIKIAQIQKGPKNISTKKFATKQRKWPIKLWKIWKQHEKALFMLIALVLIIQWVKHSSWFVGEPDYESPDFSVFFLWNLPLVLVYMYTIHVIVLWPWRERLCQRPRWSINLFLNVNTCIFGWWKSCSFYWLGPSSFLIPSGQKLLLFL